MYQIFNIMLIILSRSKKQCPINSNNDPEIRIYVNNKIPFKIKTGQYFQLLTPETIKLLGSTKNRITKDEIGENVPHVEKPEAVLVHCNIVNNDYQQDSRVLYRFIPNRSFGQLLNISSKNVIFLKTFNLEFSYFELWFTVQISEPLEVEDEINITLVIKESVKYEK